jgi:peptidyl-prolyl cis-trans isomerase A (cyclophilin A)
MQRRPNAELFRDRTTTYRGEDMRAQAILVAVAMLAGPTAQQPDTPRGEVLVRIETAFGNIDLAIDVKRAPITAGNFLKYVDGGFYDGGRFHRATRADNYKPNLPHRPLLEIIQGDISPKRAAERFPPIPLERTSVTGLTHVVGTVSMPRGDEPDSARSGFVIHLNDQPSLNHGGMRFDDGQGTAAFGRVVAGMDVVRTIQRQPVEGQSLSPPIEIRKAYRIRSRQGGPVVVFETQKGTIEIEIDADRAPITAANFLKYVEAGFYDGGVVNRAVRADNTVRHDVRIEVIQFQIDFARRDQQFAPIPLERTSVTGLKHVDGAVSMARNGPDTATASFSIVIGEQPEMDYGGKRNPDGQGFAVFGRVVRGKDVVRAIQLSATGQSGAYGTETLDPPIKVLKAYRR